MRVVADADLQALNSFHVAARARWLVELRTRQGFERLLAERRFEGLPRLFLGEGSNLLFIGDYPGVVACPRFLGHEWREDADGWRLRVGAGERWHDIVRLCVAAGRGGLENLSLIPGTVGAAPVQNIGAYGVELRERLVAVEALDTESGEPRRFAVGECDFGYRHSRFKAWPGRWLISHVELRLPRHWTPRIDYPGVREALRGREPTPRAISDAISALRRSKLPDPRRLGNAGSFFKNPVVGTARFQALRAAHSEMPGYPVDPGWVKLSAAWLIEQCGWRGYREGDAGVYPGHALVLVNHGNASGADLWTLARKIQDSVAERFGIRLEPEPRIVSAWE